MEEGRKGGMREGNEEGEGRREEEKERGRVIEKGVMERDPGKE